MEKSSVHQVASKNPLVLAFVGDAVWTLIIREKLAQASECKVGELHAHTSAFVCAGAQSRFFEQLESVLTQQEADIAKRARNAHNNTVPKNAVLAEYKRATAFEAVIGFHYLCNNKDRITELVSALRLDSTKPGTL